MTSIRIRTRSRATISVLCAIAISWPALIATAGSSRTEERILAVEGGLMKAYVLSGVNDQKVRHRLEDRMQHWHVPGVSVAVINDGVVEWTRGYGVVTDGGAAVDSQTLFQTGSIGKMITALAALILMERGMLDLGRDVNDYLTSWHLPDSDIAEGMAVTIEQVLNHSSGLTGHGFGGYTPGDTLPTLRQILDGKPPANTEAVRIAWKPGSRWKYSGGGYLVIQQVIEDVTGTPFEQIVEELVFQPLGMTRSVYGATLSPNLLENACAGHGGDGSVMEGRYRAMPEYGAGAGLWSTPSDLARLTLGIMHAYVRQPDGFVSQTTAHDMLAPRLGGYGLGAFVRGERDSFAFFHGGDNAGFHAFLVAYPVRGAGVVVMTNGDNGIPLYTEILYAVADVYGWPDFRTVEATVVEIEPDELDRLAGTYDLQDIANIPIVVKDDALFMPDLFGGGGLVRLYPISPRKFVEPSIGISLEFQVDESDRVRGANFTYGAYELTSTRVDVQGQ